MFRKLCFVAFILALPWGVAPVLSQGKDCPWKCKVLHCWRFITQSGVIQYRMYVGAPFNPDDATDPNNQTCRIVSYVDEPYKETKCKEDDNPKIEMAVYEATGDIHCKIPYNQSHGEPTNCTKGKLLVDSKWNKHSCPDT
ncbi:MAG: hypothetical protein L0Y70_22380 [Gemmataceae bacterium]|nr:hypothetical protein [Gemmataceae bacterium]